MSSKFVLDIGVGAYLMMHGFKAVGRRGKNIHFEAADPSASKDFDRLYIEYLSSPYHQFDHYLMALKKIGEYMPRTRG